MSISRGNAEGNKPLRAKPLSDLELSPVPEGLIQVAADLGPFNFFMNAGAPQHNDHKLARKKSKNAGSTYFYKRENPQLAQLEAYSANLARLIATDAYVPATTPYYNDATHDICGITSKEFIDFVPLSADPLTHDDTIVRSRSIQVERQVSLLRAALNTLIQHHKDNQAVGMLANIFGFFYVSPGATFAQQLQQIDLSDDALNDNTITHLNALLNDRLAQAIADNQNKEVALIESAQVYVGELRAAMKLRTRSLSIEELEQLDQYAKEHDIDLNTRNAFAATVNARRVVIKTSDMQHYRYIKGLAVSLTTRYLLKDGDTHALQISKDGRMIDFEMSNMPVAIKYKQLSRLSALLRTPNEQTYACTPHDIEHFPDIKADYYYWPTKTHPLASHITALIQEHLEQFKPNTTTANSQYPQALSDFIEKMRPIIKSMMTTADTSRIESAILDIIIDRKITELLKMLKDSTQEIFTESLQRDDLREAECKLWEAVGFANRQYTDDEAQAFKGLQYHPVFKFHQYRTMQKFIILDATVFDRLAELNVGVEMRAEIVAESRSRQEEVRAVLKNVPAYHDFASKHGEVSLGQIFSEFEDVRKKYTAKLTKKPYYQGFVAAVDLEEMRAKRELLVEDDAEEAVEQVSKRMRR